MDCFNCSRLDYDKKGNYVESANFPPEQIMKLALSRTSQSSIKLSLMLMEWVLLNTFKVKTKLPVLAGSVSRVRGEAGCKLASLAPEA